MLLYIYDLSAYEASKKNGFSKSSSKLSGSIKAKAVALSVNYALVLVYEICLDWTYP